MDEDNIENHEEEGSAEQPEEEPSEKPLGVTAEIEAALLSGVSKEELISMGFNKRSVETIASEIKHGKRGPGKQQSAQPAKSLMVRTAKGSPEAIVKSADVPAVVGEDFKTGLEFGMNMIILGVRVAQELSAIGVQQARPLVDMARDMRAGELAAAKAGAQEAGREAAVTVGKEIMPAVMSLDQRLSEMERPASTDPVKAMMVKIMEPIIQNTMKAFMPPGMQNVLPGTKPGEGVSLPDGWEVTHE